MQCKWAALLAAFGLAGACAGSDAAIEKRLASIESRLAALEASRNIADAGGDVSLENAREHQPPTIAEAGADADTGLRGPSTIVMVSGAGHGVVKGSKAVDSLGRCLEYAESVCRPTREQSASDVLQWRSDPGRAPAKQTPEGRACLVREEAKCKKDPLHFDRATELQRWLDRQLSPKAIETAASQAMKERLRAKMGAELTSADALEVTCVREFCRVRIAEAEPGREKLLANLNHYVRDGRDIGQILLFDHHGPRYLSRTPWVFPRTFR